RRHNAAPSPRSAPTPMTTAVGLVVGFIVAVLPMPCSRRDRFECERYALAATGAEGGDAAVQDIASHGMEEPGREHGAGCDDRMAVGYGAAFDIDDVGRQPEFARDDDSDRRERLVDFDALDVAD